MGGPRLRETLGLPFAERRRIYRRRYKTRHREELRAQGREYARNHRAEHRKYKQEHRARVLETKRALWRNDPRYRQAAAVHKSARRARQRAAVSGLGPRCWRQIQADWKGRCAYCLLAKATTLDHFVPIFHNGAHLAWNVVPACQSCNAKKGAKLPQQWCQPATYKRVSAYLKKWSRRRLEEFDRGFFIGDFEPSLMKTKKFEIALKQHKAGEDYAAHSQKRAYEYNLLVHGHMNIGKEVFNDGDIFVIAPGEVTTPVFHTDCTVVCVKVPSLPGDKVETP